MKQTRLFTLIVLLLTCALPTMAQKLKVQDAEGNPVGYAQIINHEGIVLGMTNLEGDADLTSTQHLIHNEPITITHVGFAHTNIQVTAGATDVKTVTLEDSNYSMNEVTVTPKDFIYVQTYYRVLFMTDDTVSYYRSGLIDNIYNVKKKTMKTESRHFSKAEFGLLKVLVNKLLGKTLEKHGSLPVRSEKARLVVTPEEKGRSSISYNGVTIGSRIKDFTNHQARTDIDMEVLTKKILEEKDKKKALQRMAARWNVNNNLTTIYHMDDEGKTAIEDFMMSQWHDSFDRYSKIDKKDEHVIIWLESYNVDRAYLTKQELKERKKKNRREMNITSMRQFEKERGVPAWAPQIERCLDVLFKKSKD